MAFVLHHGVVAEQRRMPQAPGNAACRLAVLLVFKVASGRGTSNAQLPPPTPMPKNVSAEPEGFAEAKPGVEADRFARRWSPHADKLGRETRLARRL